MTLGEQRRLTYLENNFPDVDNIVEKVEKIQEVINNNSEVDPRNINSFIKLEIDVPVKLIIAVKRNLIPNINNQLG